MPIDLEGLRILRLLFRNSDYFQEPFGVALRVMVISFRVSSRLVLLVLCN